MRWVLIPWKIVLNRYFSSYIGFYSWIILVMLYAYTIVNLYAPTS